MNRWTWFTICVLLGLLLFACGWLMPAHLRSIEPCVLQSAGHNTATLAGRGSELARIHQLGAAELLSASAQRAKLPESDDLAKMVAADAKKYSWIRGWGEWPVRGIGVPRTYFPKAPSAPPDGVADFTDFVVREQNRNKALEVLGTSKQPVVQELLKVRALTNTTTFAPSQSPGGEALDTAVVITALLVEEQKLTEPLTTQINSAATQANGGGDTAPLEQTLLDFLSLGQRFNWGQLGAFVGKIEDTDTLHNQAELVRTSGSRLADLFSAVELTGDPKAVAQFLKKFHNSGLDDIASTFKYNAGGVRALVVTDNPIYSTHVRELAWQYEPFSNFISASADFYWRSPEFALIVKWLLYFGAGFLFALAMHLARPPVTALEAPLQVRGFHVAREILFALGFLLVVLLVSEPFLAQEGATPAMPFRLRVPTVSRVIQPGGTNIKSTFMDKSKIIPMLLFFVLQGLLYIASVMKLAEIRRQRVGPRVKLKLLENEEHLFDAGLYLGFLGTIVAFIIYSIYVHHQFDLMVAYSSTSFGILFVSFFKIFHLRPTRRRLVMEAETESPTSAPTAATPSLASS